MLGVGEQVSESIYCLGELVFVGSVVVCLILLLFRKTSGPIAEFYNIFNIIARTWRKMDEARDTPSSSRRPASQDRRPKTVLKEVELDEFFTTRERQPHLCFS